MPQAIPPRRIMTKMPTASSTQIQLPDHHCIMLLQKGCKPL
jgi:hypothetical protein